MQDVINRLRNKKADEGFTLIELLVVVVIIGILVAIAVPVYLNYRKGAADKAAQSDVRAAVSQVEQFYTDNNNSYPATDYPGKTASFTVANTAAASGGTASATTGTPGLINLSDGTTLTYLATGTAPNKGASYKVCATNSGGTGKVYAYDSSVGGSVKALTSSSASVTTCA
ncbi:type IV pilus assembly protein PilA [Paractinoplanes atraurantiacus]|uniref:Type IV pilus assembly protein PilA n=2 Tax=Paractinoplanes atraurantiacus TaxID=1036182 RepID=A0A285H0I7_9ACTN|nr:prepilin-type N-terminal cleavage/methylation domain-containing protein [Actinoplanes atraurantiacus]SNY29265.1 type IV pilus assembly protein PilA [Actinoplanes atraurantiacus]